MNVVLEPQIFQGELMPPVNAEQSPQPQNELVRVVEGAGLDMESARSLRTAFDGMFDEAERWTATAKAIVVTDVSQTREMKLARETRLALREIRIKAESTRKGLKEDSLRRGKAIDGIANVLKFLIEPAEMHLLEQEKFVERKEAERVAALLQERQKALAPYCEWNDIAGMDFAAMTDEQWQIFFNGAKSRHDQKAEAAQKVKQEWVEREQAEATERERIRAENKRLRAEAEAMRYEREAAEAMRIEQERIASEQLEVEKARAAAELQQLEAVARAEREAAEQALAEAQEIARRERERLQAIEVERQRIAREEAAAQAAKATAEEAARKRAEAAPDKEKLEALIEAERDLPFPDLATEPARSLAVDYLRRHFELIQWLEVEIEKL